MLRRQGGGTGFASDPVPVIARWAASTRRSNVNSTSIVVGMPIATAT
jgi:hypothetical protein